MEKFDHLHGDHKRDGYKVSHKEPPRACSDPKIAHWDKFGDLVITVLEEGIEKRANQGDDDLVDEDLDN